MFRSPARRSTPNRPEPGKSANSGRKCLEQACPRADTGDVSTAVLLVVAIVLPTVAGCAALGGLRAYRWLAERHRAAHATTVPIERLGADLRRLNAQLAAVENHVAMPGKGVRVRALRAAYVDALSDACGRLQINPPGPGDSAHLALVEIYRVEAALRQRGLDVRDRSAQAAP